MAVAKNILVLRSVLGLAILLCAASSLSAQAGGAYFSSIPWVDVETYGTPSDGSSDAGPGIQLAINGSCATGGSVRLSGANGYSIYTTVDLTYGTTGCANIHLWGGKSKPSIGYGQFARAPQVAIYCYVDPCFKIDGVNEDYHTTWENMAVYGQGLGLYLKNAAMQEFKNFSAFFTYDGSFTPTGTPSTPYSTAVLLEGNTLWNTFDRGDFQSNTAGHPTIIIRYVGSSGQILFRFIQLTYAFGAVEFITDGSQSSGSTFGEMLFDTNVVEGSTSTPLLNIYNAGGVNPNWTIGRIEIHNSQIADASSHTPLIAISGLDGSHVSSLASVSIYHSLPNGPCAVQALNSYANIGGVFIDDPLASTGVCDSTGAVTSSARPYTLHANNGFDYVGTPPDSVPASSLPLRVIQEGDSYARFGIDYDGTQYFGPGGSTNAWDISLLRNAASTIATKVPAQPPTSFSCNAVNNGGGLSGTYYLKIASGNELALNPTSAASSEVSVVVGGANNGISCTWAVAIASGNVYTIYQGTSSGGENKASNFTGTSASFGSFSANYTPPTSSTLFYNQFSAGLSDIRWTGSSVAPHVGILTHTDTADRTYTFPDATGTVALANAAQTWSGNQTSMALVTPAIGGETVSAAPRSTFDCFLPAALTSTWTACTFTLDKAITVTRMQVQAKTAASGCMTNALVRLSDGSTNQDVTASASANDSGAITKNYSAAAVLTLAVQTAASGCGTSPADANVVVQYRMQ